MSVKASKIIAEAADAMFDPSYTRFDKVNDWLKWLNAGQKQTVILKPDAYVKVTARGMAAGVRQTLAANELLLFDIVRNIGTDGLTPGPAIYEVDKDHFTQLNPNWAKDQESTEVQVYMYDPDVPQIFWIYPPQPSSGSRGQVEIVLSTIPPEVSDVENDISLNDQYEDALRHYMLYRAYLVNAKHSAIERANAVQEWNHFVTYLDRRDLIEKAKEPKSTKREKINAG